MPARSVMDWPLYIFNPPYASFHILFTGPIVWQFQETPKAKKDA
jgi:hypothetical protein